MARCNPHRASADPERRPDAPTRVLVVDDHPMVRERLVEVIRAEPGFVVCGQADDRDGTLARIQAHRPHLVVLDLRLKDSDGLDLLREIRARWPTVRVLVVSMHDETLFAQHVLDAGAHGYISKQEATRNILEALHTVRAGHVYLGAAAAAKLVERIAGSSPRQAPVTVSALSPRELKVFSLLGEGFTTVQIARMLKLDRRTVETYRARIKTKLHLRTSVELLQQAIAWRKLAQSSQD